MCVRAGVALRGVRGRRVRSQAGLGGLGRPAHTAGVRARVRECAAPRGARRGRAAGRAPGTAWSGGASGADRRRARRHKKYLLLHHTFTLAKFFCFTASDPGSPEASPDVPSAPPPSVFQ